jgi:hypothetical protein
MTDQLPAASTLDVLRAVEGAWDHMVVMTYNLDIQFFERAVLDRTTGVRNAVVICDPAMYAEAVEAMCHGASLHRANAGYLIAPCHVPGATHAKLILLVRDGQARLLVGSGNLTHSGYARDAEVFHQFDATASDTGGAEPFHEVLDLLSLLSETTRLPPRAETQVNLAVEALHWLPAVSASARETRVVHNLDAPLMDALCADLTAPVDSLTLYAPFWDADASALAEALRRLRPAAVHVLVQSGISQLDLAAVEAVSSAEGVDHLSVSPARGGSMVHAKILAASTGAEVRILTGSANVSRSALLRTATSGNLELGVLTSGSPSDLDRLLMPLLGPIDALPPVPRPFDEVGDEDLTEAPAFVITAAWDGSHLTVTSPALKDAQAAAITVGGHRALETVLLPDGSITVEPPSHMASLLEAGTWVSVETLTRKSLRCLPFRLRALDAALESAPGRRPAISRIIAGIPDADDDILAVLSEIEQSLLLHRDAVVRLVPKSHPSRASTDTAADLHATLDAVWAAATNHPSVTQFAALAAGGLPPDASDLALVMAMLSSSLGAGNPTAARGPVLSDDLPEADDDEDSETAEESTTEEAIERAKERAKEQADLDQLLAAQAAAARKAYSRFLNRWCATLEDTSYLVMLGPAIASTQLVLVTRLVSTLLAKQQVDHAKAAGWLARAWAVAASNPSQFADGNAGVAALQAIEWPMAMLDALATVHHCSLTSIDRANERPLLGLTAVLLDGPMFALDSEPLGSPVTGRLRMALCQEAAATFRQDLALDLRCKVILPRGTKAWRPSIGETRPVTEVRVVGIEPSPAVAIHALSRWLTFSPGDGYIRVLVMLEPGAGPSDRVLAYADDDFVFCGTPDDDSESTRAELPDARPSWLVKFDRCFI